MLCHFSAVGNVRVLLLFFDYIHSSIVFPVLRIITIAIQVASSCHLLHVPFVPSNIFTELPLEVLDGAATPAGHLASATGQGVAVRFGLYD